MSIVNHPLCVGYAVDLILAAAPDAFGVALGTTADRIARAGLQPASPDTAAERWRVIEGCSTIMPETL
jgi:hypothetical protein